MLHGILISLLLAVFGDLRGARCVLALIPAKSIRPEPPAKGQAILIDYWQWLRQCLDFKTHLALRDVFRKEGRTRSEIVAIEHAGSIMIMTISNFAMPMPSGAPLSRVTTGSKTANNKSAS